MLGAQDWLGYERREAPRASDEQLERVHPAAHIENVRGHCERAEPFDLDTPAGPGSWEAALRGAGAACALVDALLTGEAPTGFCATRPPGHHCEADRAMGFCLFANVSIAARHAQAAHGAERVLVLDWDVHHGNGTHAIFHADPSVLFASLHQWPFYPGTGALADAGSGAGEGFTLNLPMPAGSGTDEWLGAVEHIVVPAARAYRPDLILVSAGYDAHAPTRSPSAASGPATSPTWRATSRRSPASSACRPAPCSRAATTSTRSPSPWRSRWTR